MENLHSDIESIRILTKILVQKKIRYAVLSPGSRNAPLSISIAREVGIHHFIITDERSAAFFALGLAQQTKQPVTLVCTSGTALLNYAPAVAEAYYQGIPLIVLSADRPEAWIDQDDSQTIRQNNALQNFVKYYKQLPGDITSEEDRQYTIRIINEAINNSTYHRQGPVHLNIPLREPLYNFNTPEQKGTRLIQQINTQITLHPHELKKIRQTIAQNKKIMLIAGFHAPDKTLRRHVQQLAKLPQVVVLTENLANLQLQTAITTIDRVLATLSPEEEAKFAPDILITFGGAIISRMLKNFIRTHKPKQHWHIDQRLPGPDTYQSLSLQFNMEANMFFKQLGTISPLQNHSSNYAQQWIHKKRIARERHHNFIQQLPWCDLKVFASIMPTIPKNAHLQLGNSTPIRYAQLFEEQQAACINGNRGTSGIDGCTSTAIGASVCISGTTILISGDISFLYDSNALWIKYKSPHLKIIVIQNGGGGIFRFLPGPSSLNEVEELFETPHHVNLVDLSILHGFQTFKATNEEELHVNLKSFYQENTKPVILIIQTFGQNNGEILKNYFKYLKTP